MSDAESTDKAKGKENIVMSSRRGIKGLFVAQAPRAGFLHATKCVSIFLYVWAILACLSSLVTAVGMVLKRDLLVIFSHRSYFDPLPVAVILIGIVIPLGVGVFKALALFAMARMLKYGANLLVAVFDSTEQGIKNSSESQR